MSAQDELVGVKIVDRTYHIKCSKEEAAQLQQAAQYLDEQMRQLRQSATAKTTEQVAIVAALNICHELMQFKSQNNAAVNGVNQQVKLLQQRIQKFLGSKESVMV